MGKRQDQERQAELEPKRMNFIVNILNHLELEILDRDNTKVKFMFKGSKVTFFPYSGWHSGKTITDGRGVENLVKQLQDGK